MVYFLVRICPSDLTGNKSRLSIHCMKEGTGLETKIPWIGAGLEKKKGEKEDSRRGGGGGGALVLVGLKSEVSLQVRR